MDIIRSMIPAKPYLYADTHLVSSTVTEADYTAYSTTEAGLFSAEALPRRQVVSPAGAITLTIASPCVLTWTQSQLPENTPIYFTTSGALPTGITAGKIYFVRRLTDSTYNLATKPDGQGISASGSQSGTHTGFATRHDVYEALLQNTLVTASITDVTMTTTGTHFGAPLAIGHVLSGAGVTENTTITAILTGTGYNGTYTVSISQNKGAGSTWAMAPVTNETYWARYGSTNRWAMHDSSSSSQTAKTTSIVNVYQAIGYCDSVGLLNLDCTSVNIKVDDVTDGEIYNETLSGIDNSGIIDSWHYCFDPIVRKTELLATDLPLYADPQITVTITTTTGSTALCGTLYIGKRYSAGGTLYGMGLGIQDYSVTIKDAYGNREFTEGAYSRKTTWTVNVDNRAVDALHNLLAGMRATPALYIGHADYGSSYIFGKFNDFNIEISHPEVSVCSIELESLT